MNKIVSTKHTALGRKRGVQSNLFFTLLAIVFISSAGLGFAAPPPCVSNSVVNQTELDTAITAFNIETNNCVHVITLDADIFLTTSTVLITNDHGLTGAVLIIEGSGFSVDGLNRDGVRPFDIAPDTYVTMKQITVTGGNMYTDQLTDNGGGIRNAGTLFLIDSAVSDNYAYNHGGGIYNNGTLTLTNSALSGNITDENGGGIFNVATLNLIESTISENSAEYGGGIYSTDTLTISGSTFADNLAAFNGGGIYNRGMLAMTGSNVSNNNADGGGGISNEGIATLVNSTISGNLSYTTGGGIRNAETLTLTNCTVSNNFSEGVIGGISNNDSITLNNSIVANNNLGDCVNVVGMATAFSSLIESSGSDACDLIDGVEGNIIGSDPLLESLADNGGPTQTHALRFGSLAINKGDNDLALDPYGSALTTDQRGTGYPRILNRLVDIGAYEFNPGDLDEDGDLDKNDFRIILKAFVKRACEGAPAYVAKADYNSDGCITLIDFWTWICYKKEYKAAIKHPNKMEITQN